MKKPDPAPQDAAEVAARVSAHLTADGKAPRRRKPAHAPPIDSATGIMTRASAAPVDPDERRQPQAGGRGTRDLSLRSESYDAGARTVEAILSTGAAVRRYYFTEELEISAEAIDLSRVAQGVVPLLDTHNQYELNAVIGRIIAVRIEGGQLIGIIAFADSERGREIEGRVSSGELRAISIGYHVKKWQITATDDDDHETWRAVAWELLEASLVPVPADPSAVVRSNPGGFHGNSQEEDDMRRNLAGGAAAAAPAVTAPSTAAPAVVPADRAAPEAAPPVAVAAPTAEQRAAGIPASRILDLCARSEDLGSTFAAELIRANETTPLSEADLQSRMTDRLIAARARPTSDVRAGRSGTESDSYRLAVEDALLLAANPSLRGADFGIDDQRAEAAREFRGLTLMELSRDYCQRTGIRVTGMGRMELAGAALGMRGGALTTSDFAFALGNAANRRVRRAFEAAPQSFRPFVSTGSLPDFRPASIIGMGDAPALLLVTENGEIKHGALTDTGDTYKLATYARIIPISRQAIVNDDKGLFGRIPTQFANKAADLESDLVYSQLIGNPTMPDGVALFHASHNNLAGAGTAITVTAVGAGRAAMRQQKTAEGGNMTVRARFLIVGPLQETAAEQFLTAVAAVQTTNVNPFPGKLVLVVDERITDYSWYLAADPDAFDTILLAHLEGQEELFTDTHQSFEVDGIKFKARLDVTAKVLDHRGLYKNPGAAPA